MSLTELKKVESLFRQFGYEGDEVVLALLAHYVDFFGIKMSRRLEALYQKGAPVIKHAYTHGSIKTLIKKIVDQDSQGDNLPILYQYFLSKRFRDLTGKFFTPKPVASAMIEMLPIMEDATIMDPTCGGGTILKEASKRWNHISCNLIGNDVDEMLSCLCEVNLSVNLNKAHSINCASFNIYEGSNNENNFNSVDYIVANPPFSLGIDYFSSKSKLFSLGYRNSDALFIDFAYQILKPGGRLVCLLPHSIISNKEFIRLRTTVEQDWQLLAVFVLPEGIFQSTANTTTRADIIVMEKGHVSPTNNVLFANVSSAGVALNSKKQQNLSNDLLSIVRSAEATQVLGTQSI